MAKLEPLRARAEGLLDLATNSSCSRSAAGDYLELLEQSTHRDDRVRT